MTDGQDTSSSELTLEQANVLLTQCRLRGWQVIFFGIDFDITALARSFGASAHEFITTDKESIAQLMGQVAEKRIVGKITFTEAEKKRIEKR